MPPLVARSPPLHLLQPTELPLTLDHAAYSVGRHSEDNPISDVAFFSVNQLPAIGFGSAFVHFLRSLDDRPVRGTPFVGAKDAIGL